MVRPIRFQYPGACYHIMARGDGGKINDEAQAALRRGWFLGEESFKDKLLAMVDRARGGKNQRKAMIGVASAHGEGEAERLIGVIGKILELPVERLEMEKLRKGDVRKVLLAAVLRRKTSVGVNWIAERLAMGHPGSVSRILGGIGRDGILKKKMEELELFVK